MRIAIRVVLQVLLFMHTAFCADGISIQAFYEKLGNAVSTHSTEHLIGLLDWLEGSTVWSFGSGVGPTDVDSLQCAVVDSYLKIEAESATERNISTTRAANKWVGAFQVTPIDSISMMRLLRSQKPAFRLIALRRIERFQQIDTNVVRRLKTLMGEDPYVRIVRKADSTQRHYPAPPGLDESDIEFPLRVIARQILSDRGIPVDYDAEKEAVEGVCYLAQLWVDNPRYREDIQDAISLLNPRGYGVRAIRKLAYEVQSNAVYHVFRRQLN